MRPYNPCIPGISITGIDDGGNGFYTIENFPGASRAAFDRLREFQCIEGEPEDCIIDLFEPEGMTDNIPITRQMVQRVCLAVGCATETECAG